MDHPANSRLGRIARRMPLAFELFVAVAIGLMATGCASTKMAELREVPKSPLIERFQLLSEEGPRASGRTRQFLRVNGLMEYVGGDSRVLLDKVQEVIDREPTADNVYAFAELSFLEAKKAENRDPRLALDLYGASVLHAFQYLFDERFAHTRNPYDPHYRGACDLYNGALETALRLVCEGKGLVPNQTYTIETASGSWDITCELRSSKWRPEDFGRFEFCSDYQINGLKNEYHSYGLGVPLIAVRSSYPNEPPAARYYPADLSFPVTALVRPTADTNPPAPDTPVRHRAVLELYDPLATSHVEIGGWQVPLESDLTTPMAYFLSNPAMGNLATIGLLRPEMLLSELRPDRKVMGLYMVQPYEPGKIPVLMVHGLWSSPMTWMEMFNDLRSSPEIRKHYQFWFYLYPTAQPFWVSAAMLRKDLADVRETVDPEHREPALDQMVLVGHSMGGLVSRLQTINSRDDFWKIVSDQPFQHVKAEPEVLDRLQDNLFFRPSASIRRVVTVGTPHRGSHFSNSTTRWISGKLIRLPQIFIGGQQALFKQNRELIRDEKLLRIETSIDSLAPNSPFFPVMLASQRAPWVRYHNIIGLVPERGLFGKWAAGSDGVVTYESARMDDVESELIVPADHTTVQSHPLAVLEVRRVLLKHLDELRNFPGHQSPKILTAGTPSPAQ
jgi:pimeloyl-ACP methyl ester carboxylesterase